MRRLTPINAPGLKTDVVHVSQLRAAGVKHWRINARDLDAPMRGTRASPAVDGSTFEARAGAMQLLLSKGQFLSRRSAAQLLKMPIQDHRGPLEVGAVRPRRPPERPQVVGHQVQPGLLATTPEAPLWLPSPEETWALLAPVTSKKNLVVVGDHLISTTRKSTGPGCTIEQLTEAVGRFTRCRGVERLREALALVRPGVASPPETLLRLLIVEAGFPEPVTNCPVQTFERELHADLGYPQWCIAIEYDGAYHFENGAPQAKFDDERRESMRDAGWIVIQLTSLSLRSPGRFLRRLAREIARAQNR